MRLPPATCSKPRLKYSVSSASRSPARFWAKATGPLAHQFVHRNLVSRFKTRECVFDWLAGFPRLDGIGRHIVEKMLGRNTLYLRFEGFFINFIEYI